MKVYELSQNVIPKINPNFKGKAGQFINPAAKNQINNFTDEFEYSVKSNTPIMGQFDYLVRSIYPDLKFELRDISEVKNSDIQERKPIIFLRSNFDGNEPKTIIYLNQDKFKDMSENSPEKIHEYAQRVGSLLARKNEMNFISKIVNECVTQFTKTKDLSLDYMNKFLKDIIQKYKLDIDVTAIDKNTLGNLPGTHCTLNSIRFDGELSSRIAMDLNKPEDSIKRGFVHELHHVLNFNSVEFNQIYNQTYLMNTAKPQHDMLEYEFVRICDNDPYFLKQNTKHRNEVYNNLFKKVFKVKPSTPEQLELMIKVLEENVRDETFTYEKTPKNPNEYPIGTLFNDFYKYLLSVKYDADKRDKLLNS